MLNTMCIHDVKSITTTHERLTRTERRNSRWLRRITFETLDGARFEITVFAADEAALFLNASER